MGWGMVWSVFFFGFGAKVCGNLPTSNRGETHSIHACGVRAVDVGCCPGSMLQVRCPSERCLRCSVWNHAQTRAHVLICNVVSDTYVGE